jgi:hypothetical protein
MEPDFDDASYRQACLALAGSCLFRLGSDVIEIAHGSSRVGAASSHITLRGSHSIIKTSAIWNPSCSAISTGRSTKQCNADLDVTVRVEDE